MLSNYTEIIDLTVDITNGMPVPPANRKTLPPVNLKLYKEADRDGIQVGFFQTGIHAGTHLDAPRHILAGGQTMDQLDLKTFMGPAYCIDVTAVKPCEAVTADMLEHARSKIRPGMMVFLYTGWIDKMYYQDEYWSDSPYLGEDAAQWLVDVGASIAGYDFFQDIGAKAAILNPDNFVVHKILLSNGVLNIEHVCNLALVSETEFEVIALPLKIIGAEGSPSRVIALR